MMEGDSGADTSAASARTSKACERCRKRKVKCSGRQPCEKCVHLRRECVFAESSNRISVSEAYLRRLENQCRLQARVSSGSQPPSSSTAPAHTTATPSATFEAPQTSPHQLSAVSQDRSATVDTDTSDADFALNPLINSRSFIRDGRGRPCFLGPSSTWSFCRRVIAVLEGCGHQGDRLIYPMNLDGVAFTVSWSHLPDDAQPDVTGLPSIDFSLYLYNTFQFHLGQVYRFVCEDSFEPLLHRFYQDPLGIAKSNRLWFAQFLLVLGFGKAFLAHTPDTSNPPGWEYASRALALLPDSHDIFGDRLTEIEVLCLAAIYLQALDMRATAFKYIGQALRLCFISGIHRECPEETHGRALSNRCSNLWWSLYALDQEFSALIGAPCSIRDEDITTPLPSDVVSSPRAMALTLQVRLSRVTARILNMVYAVGGPLSSSFLPETRSILCILADLSLELDNLIGPRREGAVGGLSRVSTHLTLAYHHCIVLTTRPLVIGILTKCISDANSPSTQQPLQLQSPISALLQTCIDSAKAVLQMLRALCDLDLLETFLSSHLEDLFSSSVVLCIVHTTAPHFLSTTTTTTTTPNTTHDFHNPHSAQQPRWATDAHYILDRMIQSGNATAGLRKAELQQLSILLAQTPMTTISPATPVAVSEAGERGSGDAASGESMHDAGLQSGAGVSAPGSGRDASHARYIGLEDEGAASLQPHASAAAAGSEDWGFDPFTLHSGAGFGRDNILMLAQQLADDEGVEGGNGVAQSLLELWDV